MNVRVVAAVSVIVFLSFGHATVHAGPSINDEPAKPYEWGLRPAPESTSAVNPPSFVWRPQEDAKTYAVQCARSRRFEKVDYEVRGLEFNCHCPPRPLDAGQWYWRFRFVDAKGKASRWSRVRRFVVPVKAVEMPMPVREELLGRIPKTHPRLFVRPEDLPELRRRAKTDLKSRYDRLVARCERILQKPPSTAEPPKYPQGTVRKSEEWRKIWWGNRNRTRAVLENASYLAFARLLGGKEEYGRLAKRLLLGAAEWDPKGATGYRYNDEAGMPFAYYFARTYTFVNDLLTEAEREKCRKVMRIRGEEMYHHLCPRHLWTPYRSHSNRAWHFLGEVGVAFLDEIPEARDWAWFAMNVFFNVYPVWCDDDGGWHEGVSYWRSYIYRFTWWADVMRAAMGIDAYRKPYFAKAGYYAMYLMPPGTHGGGFGDLTGSKRAEHCRELMTTLASQAKNAHWQWYVNALGGPDSAGGYVGFVRGALPKIEPRPPTDLPTSRCFWGIGQAYLNTNLLDGTKNVGVRFKSSPFGGRSHGYESSNAFLLQAFGERLLIRSGRRDVHGSKHHRRWMHSTRSVNCITVNGEGQLRHTSMAPGKIEGFRTGKEFDYVRGEAGKAYGDRLERFSRHILFVKPELVVIYDRLEAPKPSTFEWWLHALKPFEVKSQRDIHTSNDKAACHVSFLVPDGLTFDQADKCDPPPRPRIKLTQWHLKAKTSKPAKRLEFVTLLRPYRSGSAPALGNDSVERTDAGYLVRAGLTDGSVVVGLRAKDGPKMRVKGVDAAGDVVAIRYDTQGKPVARFAGP